MKELAAVFGISSTQLINYATGVVAPPSTDFDKRMEETLRGWGWPRGIGLT
jgi:hypothetical protein